MAFDPISAISGAVSSIATSVDSWFTTDEEQLQGEAGIISAETAQTYADAAYLQAQDSASFTADEQQQYIIEGAIILAIIITIIIAIIIIKK